MTEPLMHVGAAKMTAAALSARGVDPAPILATCNIRLDEDRVPLRAFQALLAEASRATDEAFCLSLGKNADPAQWDVLGLFAAVTQTLDEAVNVAIAFGDVWSQATSYEKVGSDVTLRVRGEPPNVYFHHQLAVGAFVGVGQAIAADPWVPDEVEFAFPAPKDPDPFSNYFGCPVHFNRPTSCIHFPADLKTMHVKKPNAALRALLEDQATACLQRLPASTDLVAEVRRCVGRTIVRGVPTIATVAGELGMSARTLQRKLDDEGERFAVIADGVRREMAVQLLSDQAIDLVSVALRLGFTDPSALHRAVKRWTGESVADLRQAANA